MKKRKFHVEVSRYFNPQKSGTNAEFNKNGTMRSLGTHQYQKTKESSYIPVYNKMGTARVSVDRFGNKTYK